MRTKIFRPIFNNDGVHQTRGDQRESSSGLQERTSNWYNGQFEKGFRSKLLISVIAAHVMLLYGCNAIDAAVDYNLDQHGFKRYVDPNIKLCEYKVSEYRTEFRACSKTGNK